MSSPAVQEEQLLELLLQLKKTTPDQSRAILNAQPQIAYALMAIMVNLGAINMEVTQKALTSFSSGAAPSACLPLSSAPPASGPPVAQPPPAQPMAAIPPHMAGPSGSRGATPPQYRDTRAGTPQYTTPPRGHTPSYPPTGPGYPAHPGQPYPPGPSGPPSAHNSYGGPPGPPPQMGYGGPPPPSAPPNLPPGVRPEIFASLPEDQKPVVLGILNMTPEQVAQLPPNDRASITQLRQTLGLPQ